ncbi:MAG TPA: hypothetical protein VFR05_04315, partial [Terriglobia bacterium]|nr:hypothetical protein [Terriglobia bacterium]
MKAAAALLSIALIQSQSAYVREGDRVEQQFHGYRDRLAEFFDGLRTAIRRDLAPGQAAVLLQQLEKA